MGKPKKKITGLKTDDFIPIMDKSLPLLKYRKD